MLDPRQFVGAWRLVSWEIREPDGTVWYPFGKDAIGYLLYTADGHMAAEIMDSDRRQSDPNFPREAASAQTLPEEDRARAYDTYLSYCGTYTVEADRVVHHVKAGLIPSWTGTDQVRPCRFEGGRLVIGVGHQVLTWERAVPHE
jgi:hypothetical protein